MPEEKTDLCGTSFCYLAVEGATILLMWGRIPPAMDLLPTFPLLWQCCSKNDPDAWHFGMHSFFKVRPKGWTSESLMDSDVRAIPHQQQSATKRGMKGRGKVNGGTCPWSSRTLLSLNDCGWMGEEREIKDNSWQVHPLLISLKP